MTGPTGRLVIVGPDASMRSLQILRDVEESGSAAVLESDSEFAGSLPGEVELVIIVLSDVRLESLRLVKAIRSRSPVPILVIADHHGVQERVTLLDAGADHVMEAPYSPRELSARVRALRRRTQLQRTAAPG